MMIKNVFMCVWCGEELQQPKLHQTKTQGSADTEENPNFVQMFHLIFVFIFTPVESLLL